MKAAGDCPGTSSRLPRSVTSFSSPDSPPEPEVLLTTQSQLHPGGLDSLSPACGSLPAFHLDNSHEMIHSRPLLLFRLLWLLLWGTGQHLLTNKLICLVERVDPTPKVSWTIDVCLLYAIFQHLGVRLSREVKGSPWLIHPGFVFQNEKTFLCILHFISISSSGIMLWVYRRHSENFQQGTEFLVSVMNSPSEQPLKFFSVASSGIRCFIDCQLSWAHPRKWAYIKIIPYFL